MNERTILERLLRSEADPNCKECDGAGYVEVSGNNNPDRCRREICTCVMTPAEYFEEGNDGDS